MLQNLAQIHYLEAILQMFQLERNRKSQEKDTIKIIDVLPKK